MRNIRACAAQRLGIVVRGGEQGLRRPIGHQDLSGRIADDDRIDHGVDDLLDASPLGSRLCFCCAEPLVVVFDLPGRASQVGDVPQHGHERTLPALGFEWCAQELEEQIGAVFRIDQDHFASPNPSIHRHAAERRREVQIIELQCVPSSLARFSRPCEQLLRSRIAHQQLALRVSQENRIADSVDDREQQSALAIESTILCRVSRSQSC